jgi:hypothetical protein
LEEFAVQFDPLFHTLAQRHGFRTYLAGLLMPRDRSKTLTALVGAEPLAQAQVAEVQRLQSFLYAAVDAAGKKSTSRKRRRIGPGRRVRCERGWPRRIAGALLGRVLRNASAH